MFLSDFVVLMICLICGFLYRECSLGFCLSV